MEAVALSRIDWGKSNQTLPAESTQATVTATLTGQGKDYIEAIPCSHQAIESFAPSVHDNAQVVCKSMTMPEIDSDSDSSHGPDPSWNPNCMNISDWVRVQAKDPVIHDLIQWYGTKELHKGKDTDSLGLGLRHHGIQVLADNHMRIKMTGQIKTITMILMRVRNIVLIMRMMIKEMIMRMIIIK